MTINLTLNDSLTAFAAASSFWAHSSQISTKKTNIKSDDDEGGGGGRNGGDIRTACVLRHLQSCNKSSPEIISSLKKQQVYQQKIESFAMESTQNQNLHTQNLADETLKNNQQLQIEQQIISQRVIAPAPALLFSETTSVVRQRASDALVLTKAARSQQRRCLMLALLVSSFCIVGCAPAWRRLAAAAPTFVQIGQEKHQADTANRETNDPTQESKQQALKQHTIITSRTSSVQTQTISTK